MKESKWWDRAWSLVDGCTPCSPGCDHCWSMAMNKRFHKWPEKVTPRHDRLDLPLKTRKPTVFAVWNDLFHEDVPEKFITSAYMTIFSQQRHTFLVLTKRPERMSILLRLYKDFYTGVPAIETEKNIYHGLTICNQQEADEKLPIFLKVPGKKFLSIEPMLGEIKLNKCWICQPEQIDECLCEQEFDSNIDAVILGGETGPGARPLHPDWVRSVRDQCEGAGVPFFFKQWGEYGPNVFGVNDAYPYERLGHNKAGRLLDGRIHDDLPWNERTVKNGH